LAAPNLFELALISRIWHYHHVIKIQPNSGHHGSRSDYSRLQMKGHSILFGHDAPKISALMLMMKSSQSESFRETLRDILTIHFVGPEEEMDRLAKMLSHPLKHLPIQAKREKDTVLLYQTLLHPLKQGQVLHRVPPPNLHSSFFS
jgi:hypothetical protein